MDYNPYDLDAVARARSMDQTQKRLDLIEEKIAKMDRVLEAIKKKLDHADDPRNFGWKDPHAIG